MESVNNGWKKEQVTGMDERINLSREQHQSLVELSPEPIIICCGNRVLYVNPACVHMIGATHKSELLNKHVSDFLYEDHQEILQDEFELFIHENKPSKLFEKKLIRLDGMVIIVQVRAIPLLYNGKPSVQFLCRNITEQRKTEQILLDSEQRYRHMIEMSPQAIVIHKDGIITSVNEATLKLLQIHGIDQVIGKSFMQFIHSDHQELAKQRIIQTEENEEPNDFVAYKLVGKDGFIYEVEISSICIKSLNGDCYIQSVLRDNTERRREEQILRESARAYERLIEFLPEPIVVTDEGTIIYLNVSAEKLMRSEISKELVGKSLFDYIHPCYWERMQAIIHNVMLDDTQTPFIEKKMICCDGTNIDVEVSCIRLQNFMGKTVVLCVLRDMTERKHAEEMLVKSEKLSVIGQLAAGVAHEIRNPLTVLRGFTQLLQNELGSRHAYLSLMLSELDRINNIVNEFMTLSKPQFVQFNSHRINNILNSVLSILETQAILVNVNIKISYANRTPHIHCDENQMKQVFINVIKNAIEAMPFGGEIDIVVETTNDNQLLVRIIDQGPGIPQEVINRVGEPFYTTKENGTGLGLMVCHRIIEAHQGALHLTSDQGKGTRVDITLPIREDDVMS